jgi:hypothetical protein
MAAYGYARVSSDGQCLDAQREALTAAGAAKIFAEKLSGASAANRKELAKVMAKLEPGDVLLVTRLDRLARSTRDLLNVLDLVSKAGAGFRSLADAWAGTTTRADQDPHQRGACAREGARRSHGQALGSESEPAARGPDEDRGRRRTDGHRPHLRGFSHDHRSTEGKGWA